MSEESAPALPTILKATAAVQPVCTVAPVGIEILGEKTSNVTSEPFQGHSTVNRILRSRFRNMPELSGDDVERLGTAEGKASGKNGDMRLLQR